jgi:flagellar FliJ protein
VFVFKFEKILKLKDDLIRQKMLEIANIETMIAKNRKKKEKLEDDNLFRRKKIDEILKQKPKKGALLFYFDNIERTLMEIKDIEIAIESLKKEKNIKLEEIKLLDIEKKKLEKLKEKEYRIYVDEQNKSETRFLDEIASIKAANRIIGS